MSRNRVAVSTEANVKEDSYEPNPLRFIGIRRCKLSF